MFLDKRMKLLKSIAPAIMIMITFVGSESLVAQSQTRNVKLSETEPAQKTIGFRSIKWQTKHIHDAGEAARLIESLEKIGCEVIQQDHNGHLDVRYRCPTWKSISVQNDEFASQWSAWLAGNGIEAVIVDPPATPGLEILRFRLADWHNVHMSDANEVAQMISMLKMIGCQAEQHEHNGHIDVRFKCADWKTIALHNHEAAHSWQGWLNNLGFQTEHTH